MTPKSEGAMRKAEAAAPSSFGRYSVQRVIVSLVTSEIAFRLGRWWQLRSPGEQEVPLK